ncbi:hypothetical protein [Legionella impletisoli]|uniref:Uncharacterized protein n=1 Tax=Legionella impletisoli TaxID=343510 RepID=A0A917N8Z2_9GAMM|nr:hypothetical protein [Legionella impletisoli]GGI78224.1 hypothetical protein GCM10007966_03650 [Legionella impletisoli]
MATIRISKKKRLLDALHALKLLAKSKEGIDVAVLRAGKLKKPGLEYDERSHLGGKVALSTANIWDVFDSNGQFQEKNATIAGIKLNRSDLQNPNKFLPKEQVDALSDEERLVLDALFYDISSSLTDVTLLMASNSSDEIQAISNAEEIMREAFQDIDFRQLHEHKEVFIQRIEHKITEIETKPETPLTVEVDDDLVTPLASDETDYKAAIQRTNQAEQKKKHTIDKIREEKLESFERLMDVLEKANNPETSLDELIATANDAKQMFEHEDAEAFRPEVKQLKSLYSSIVKQAFQQAAMKKNIDSINEITQQIHFTPRLQSPDRDVVFDIIDELNRVEESTQSPETIIQQLTVATKLISVLKDPGLQQSLIGARNQLLFKAFREKIDLQPVVPALTEELTQLARSKEFLEGSIPQQDLISNANIALELYNSKSKDLSSSQTTQNETLKSLYSHFVTEALYQSMEQTGPLSVSSVTKAVNLNLEPESPGRTFLVNLIHHFNNLADSIGSTDNIQVNLEEATEVNSLVNKALSLSEALLPEVTDEVLYQELSEANKRLFLLSVKQDIEVTTLSKKGWDTLSRYRITIEHKTYPVPKRIYEQYQAIKEYEQGSASTNNAVNRVIDSGERKSSSRFFGPSTTTTTYFNHFKEQATKLRQSEQPSEPETSLKKKL